MTNIKIDLSNLDYKFIQKPLLVGGKAKEYYEIRKSGIDTDLIVSSEDYESLAEKYPANLKDLFGDKGVIINDFEIWKTICLYDYDFLSEDATEVDDYKIISIEKLTFLTALAIKKEKYLEDLKLLVDKVFEIKYKIK
ncbi:hypothetical protein KC678_00360 [Candidatus Dojkabacteria bacterium]|uniref:Uncharacterized protein n=1 Tax=Candidatus Dojkabacteria bacterium TaxID=2099670 RepID=A0A955L1G3_9BACT|nr:hypothetical protein [Candidatus Dojkabacteria bacterium]